MKLRVAKKVLRTIFLGTEWDWAHRYKRPTIERAIRRINPSAWSEGMYQPRDWDTQLLWCYRNKKIRSAIRKTWLRQYQQELEELWSKMGTSANCPTTTW